MSTTAMLLLLIAAVPDADVGQRVDAIADGSVALTWTDDAAQDGRIEQGAIRLTRETVALLRSPQEVDGVLAVLVAFGGAGTRVRQGLEPPNLLQVAGAVAYGAVASAIDPVDRRDQLSASKRDYSLDRDARTLPAPAGTPSGRAALALMQAHGSCSGAALAGLERIAARYAGVAAPLRPPIAGMAQRARAAFGALAMPPDDRCTA